MNPDSEKAFLEKVRQQLDGHAESLDEVTTARLRSARMRALDAGSQSRIGWLPMTGLATAAAALLAVVIWNQLPPGDPVMPGDWNMLATSEELELIDELDFYAWLEESEASS